MTKKAAKDYTANDIKKIVEATETMDELIIALRGLVDRLDSIDGKVDGLVTNVKRLRKGGRAF